MIVHSTPVSQDRPTHWVPCRDTTIDCIAHATLGDGHCGASDLLCVFSVLCCVCGAHLVLTVEALCRLSKRDATVARGGFRAMMVLTCPTQWGLSHKLQACFVAGSVSCLWQSFSLMTQSALRDSHIFHPIYAQFNPKTSAARNLCLKGWDVYQGNRLRVPLPGSPFSCKPTRPTTTCTLWVNRVRWEGQHMHVSCFETVTI